MLSYALRVGVRRHTPHAVYRTMSLNSLNRTVYRSTVHVGSYLEQLLSASRGFKKFYRNKECSDSKEGSTSSQPSKEGSTSNESSENNNSRTNKGGSGKDPGGGDEDPFGKEWAYLPLAVVSGLTAIALYRLDSSTHG